MRIREIENFKKMGIEVQSFQQPIDYSSPEFQIMVAIYLIEPVIGNMRRSNAIKAGIRNAKLNRAGSKSANERMNRSASRVPYGYKIIYDKNGKPRIVPDKKHQVKKMFENKSK